jgi:hypothetical protein
VYNIELVRQLCRDINKAKDDPRREKELLSLLQAVIKEDQEEVRVRMNFLKRQGIAFSNNEGAE